MAKLIKLTGVGGDMVLVNPGNVTIVRHIDDGENGYSSIMFVGGSDVSVRETIERIYEASAAS